MPVSGLTEYWRNGYGELPEKNGMEAGTYFLYLCLPGLGFGKCW